VQVRLGASIAGATASAALLSTGEQIPTRSLIVTVGVRPNPVVTGLPFAFDEGRIKTDRFCRVPDHPGVYAVGDNAAVPHPKTGEACGPTAIYAFTQGPCAADNVMAEHRGESPRPYRFAAFGEAAALSNTFAIIEMFGVPLSGIVGMTLWRLGVLAVIPSWPRRFAIMFDWFASMVLPADIAQLKVARSDAIVPLRFAAGESIIRQGEPGSRFYIVTEGAVEVLRTHGTGPRNKSPAWAPASSSVKWRSWRT
jgi:NADH dehydrogenase